MSRPVVIGLDLSTHGVKVVGVTPDGRIPVHIMKHYQRIIGADGSHIQPIDDVSAALKAALKDIAERFGSHYFVEGIAVAHQRGTLIGVDHFGNAVVPTICDSDTRAWQQAQWIQKLISSRELIKRTGCPPVPFNGLMKILWWYQQYPEDAAKVRWWMSVQDWAVWKLTGQFISSPGAALRQGLLNIAQPIKYDVELLNRLQIPLETLLPLAPFGKQIGALSSEFGNDVGLPSGIPVFPSSGDQPAAVLGTGAISRGAAVINLGTSFLLSFILQTSDIEPGSLFPTLELLPDGRYALEYGEGAGTNILDWLRNQLLNVKSIHKLNELGRSSPRGARGVVVIPHWWAIMDAARCGVITGLRSHNTQADLVRATYEGLSYEVRICWEKLEHISGFSPALAAVCGGASRNGLFCQILSSTLDIPVYRTSCKEASALGAAITAALALGWAVDGNTAEMRMVKVEPEIYPNIEDRSFYQDGFQNYLLLRKSHS